MYVRSIDFIRDYPEAKTQDIPSELLYFWIVPDGRPVHMEVNRLSPAFHVFREALSHSLIRGGGTPYPEQLAEALFCDYQTFLSLEEVSRRTTVKIPSIPIFDFHNYPWIRENLKLVITPYEIV